MDNLLFLLSARWQGAAGLNLLQSLSTARQFFHDRFHGSGPDKRFGIFIPSREKLSDGFFQITDVEKRTSANTLPRQFTKPAFYQVQPTRTGWYEMKHETRMLFPPGLNLLLFVGAIVVHHQV